MNDSPTHDSPATSAQPNPSPDLITISRATARRVGVTLAIVLVGVLGFLVGRHEADTDFVRGGPFQHGPGQMQPMGPGGQGFGAGPGGQGFQGGPEQSGPESLDAPRFDGERDYGPSRDGRDSESDDSDDEKSR